MSRTLGEQIQRAPEDHHICGPQKVPIRNISHERGLHNPEATMHALYRLVCIGVPDPEWRSPPRKVRPEQNPSLGRAAILRCKTSDADERISDGITIVITNGLTSVFQSRDVENVEILSTVGICIGNLSFS